MIVLTEATVSPQLLEEGLTLFRRVLEAGLLRERIQETTKALLAELKQLRVPAGFVNDGGGGNSCSEHTTSFPQSALQQSGCEDA